MFELAIFITTIGLLLMHVPILLLSMRQKKRLTVENFEDPSRDPPQPPTSNPQQTRSHDNVPRIP